MSVLWIVLVNFICEIDRLRNLIPHNNIDKRNTSEVELSGEIIIYGLFLFTPVGVCEFLRCI